MIGSDWLFEVAIESGPAAWESVQTALGFVSRLYDLRVQADPTALQVVLGARTEEHLAIALLHLQEAVPDGYRSGAVQVAYCATLADPVEISYVHKKQSGGSGEFAAVTVRFVPGERGSGFQFFSEDAAGHVPVVWLPSVEQGVREAAESGDPLGLPLIDVEAHLLDGTYHDLDSSSPAFERAGAGAMRHAAQRAGLKLLEPIVKVAVLAQERWLTGIVAELERRNAAIDEVRLGRTSLIIATARMADMLGFEAALSAATNGRARAAIVLQSYEDVPGEGGPDESYPIGAALRA